MTLTEHGADLNALSRYRGIPDATPLFCACWTSRNVALARWFRDQGAPAGDAEFAAALGQPLSPNERFVTALYRDLLDRQPDAVGLAFWSNMLDRGVSRAQVALYIEGTSEYQGDQVNSAFERYLRRSAEAGTISAFVAMLDRGATIEQLDVVILSSQEYFGTQGGSTNAGFLNALFQDTLGRPIDGPTETLFAGLLSSGASRSAIAQVVLASAEYRHDLVNSMYEQYLRRPADSAALASGVAQLDAGQTPTVFASEILGSAEYFERLSVRNWERSRAIDPKVAALCPCQGGPDADREEFTTALAVGPLTQRRHLVLTRPRPCRPCLANTSDDVAGAISASIDAITVILVLVLLLTTGGQVAFARDSLPPQGATLTCPLKMVF